MTRRPTPIADTTMPDHGVSLAGRGRHRYGVRLSFVPQAGITTVSLPVWVPGSYRVRDFARHLGPLQASQAGRACSIEQIGKSAWQVEATPGKPVELRYEAHARDPGVRAAWLDGERGFFNGAALLLQVHGQEHRPQRLTLEALPDGWQVATAMPPDPEAPGERWLAADYLDLIDHPFEIGRFESIGFDLRGVPATLAVTGAWPGWDRERLAADVARVCRAVAAFWAPVTPAPPFDRYVLLLNLGERGDGGLEHRASTALMARRGDLPRTGQAPPAGYAGLLGLVAHEVFHAWHVKRLKPAELDPPPLDRETLTPLLWLFEGFTTYYEDLLGLRAGVLAPAELLRHLAGHLDQLAMTPGRAVHSLADASREAWTKAYQPDEATPNLTVSYYAKGALVALALDLSLRRLGSRLDALMHRLWQRGEGGAVTEADAMAALADVLADAGTADARRIRALQQQWQAWVHGTGELPLPPLLAATGIEWVDLPAPLGRRLGMRLAEGPVTGVRVQQVWQGGAAQAGGIQPADEILAVNGWRVRRFDEAAAWVADGEPLELLVSREERIVHCRLPWPGPRDFGKVELRLHPRPGPRPAAGGRTGSAPEARGCRRAASRPTRHNGPTQ